MLVYINLVLSLLTNSPAIAPNIAPEAALASVQDVVKAPEIPFFSQFADIEFPEWRKKACGVASLAMIIDSFRENTVSAQTLLEEGIAAGAYSENGWTHKGLIRLAEKYGFKGETQYLTELTDSEALSKLTDILKDGPVMASVFYKFDPQSTIPHLVVVSGISDDVVYYSDPAEKSGNKEISIANFMAGWKKRIIVIRPEI